MTGLCIRNGLQLGFQIAGARVLKLWKQLLLLRGVECSHLTLVFLINLFGCSTISENGSKDTLVQTLRYRQIAISLSSHLVSWGLHQENLCCSLNLTKTKHLKTANTRLGAISENVGHSFSSTMLQSSVKKKGVFFWDGSQKNEHRQIPSKWKLGFCSIYTFRKSTDNINEFEIQNGMY